MIRAFSRVSTWAIAVSATMAAYLALAWIPAVPLVTHVLLAPLPVPERASLIADMLIASSLDFMRLSDAMTLVVPLLVGVNAALLVFALRLSRVTRGAETGSLIASAAGLFGIGCAACGSTLFASLMTIIGAGSLVLLPFGGDEVGYLGVALLCISIALLARSIARPPTCPI